MHVTSINYIAIQLYYNVICICIIYCMYIPMYVGYGFVHFESSKQGQGAYHNKYTSTFYKH